MSLSSKFFRAYINLGKDSILLSTNINYKFPNHNSIYFSNLVVERERGKVICIFAPTILRRFTIHYKVIISLYYLFN